jgi:hypothetical protein
MKFKFIYLVKNFENKPGVSYNRDALLTDIYAHYLQLAI